MTKNAASLPGALFVIVLGAVMGGAAMTSLPADDHEVLVLRTSQEMYERGDWIVPYFNGEPRLNKPPINYWLTGLTAAVARSPDRVEAWHGRLPSLLAGIGLLTIMTTVGSRFFGGRAALYGAGLFATSSGFFSYAHDARPELVYAFFCMAGLGSFMLATLTRARASAGWIYLMWAAYAFAILTKGPQVPAMLLVASGLFLAFVQGRGLAGLRVLKPIAGLALLAALTIPWWWLLKQGLAGEQVVNSQLAGILLVPDFQHLLNGYYFYRPLQLVLPWLPLIPVAWIVAMRVRDEGREACIFLATTVLVAVLAFSFGGQQRYFYLLPLLPVMCLLAGRGVERMLAWGGPVFFIVLAVQAAVVFGAAGWLHLNYPRPTVLAATVGAVLIAGSVGRKLSAAPFSGVAVALVVLVANCFAGFADAEVFWSADRRHKHLLARSIKTNVAPDAPLVSLDLTPAVYVYESGRTIRRLRNMDELGRTLDEIDGPALYVLTLALRRAELDGRYKIEEVRAMPKGASDRAALYRISIGSRED
ncbi:MAG: glycosyltransferase family 39 protein [Pseudomonadota bacterium]|nr:glycosyltransferase family 39 protein [Pseudomonadota bacterium]